MATIQQKKAAELLVENSSRDKPKRLGEIIKEAGYSDNTAIKPSQVINSKGFQEVIEQAGITDEKLARLLDDGLSAEAYIKTERVEGEGKGRLKTEEVITVPDLNTRHKYLETSLRLKGHSKGNTPNILVIPLLGGLSVPTHDSNAETSQA